LQLFREGPQMGQERDVPLPRPASEP